MISNPERFKENFVEKFSGLIWRVGIQEDKGYLAIESREIETKKVFFSVLNLQTGELFFKEKVFAESMNANLAYLSEHNLLLKLNENSESLECKGLIAIDLKSAEIIWEKYNFGLHQATSYGIQIFDPRIYPRKFSWVNHKTADLLPDPETPLNEYSSLLFPEINRNYTFPDFLSHNLIIGDVWEVKINNLQIICFHEKIEDKLQQRLLIYQIGKVLHDDILIQNIQKLQPESFFIINKQLLYIRNKNEIVSYFV